MFFGRCNRRHAEKEILDSILDPAKYDSRLRAYGNDTDGEFQKRMSRTVLNSSF